MDRRARALLERRLRSARHIGQHLQGFDHRLLTHEAAPDRAEPAFLMGDRYREIGLGLLERPERHRHRGFLADRAERRKRCGIDAEHRVLGLVGIGDEAAIDHVR